MKNDYEVKRVTLTKQLSAWCPLGEQEYTADVTVKVLPEDTIPDYCELDAELSKINGSLIIEELASKVFSVVSKAFSGALVKVTVSVPQSKHMPVIVEVGGF